MGAFSLTMTTPCWERQDAPVGMIGAARGSYQVMTTDGRPPASEEPAPVGNAPTDPPAYREAATPQDVEESQEREDKGSES